MGDKNHNHFHDAKPYIALWNNAVNGKDYPVYMGHNKPVAVDGSKPDPDAFRVLREDFERRVQDEW